MRSWGLVAIPLALAIGCGVAAGNGKPIWFIDADGGLAIFDSGAGDSGSMTTGGPDADKGDSPAGADGGMLVAPSFTDVSQMLGFAPGGTQCLALEDFDGDGRPDVFMDAVSASGSGTVTLYLNGGNGSYKAVPAAIPFVDDQSGACGAGDLDNDGLPDLVLTVGFQYPVYVMHNVGGGNFKPWSKLQLPTQMAKAGGGPVGVADFDGDGWLDIVVAQYQPAPGNESCGPTPDGYACTVPSTRCGLPPVIYRNNGDGTFGMPVSVVDPTSCGPANANALAIVDYDRDGKPDIFIANDWGVDSLYVQSSTALQFTDVAPTLALKGFNHAMGAAFGDYDLDGNLDFFVSDLGSSQFYLGQGSGAVAAAGKGWGVAVATTYTSDWAALADDFDSDGFTDIWAVNAALVHSYAELGVVAGARLGNDGGVTFMQEVNSDFLFQNAGGHAFTTLIFPQTLDAIPEVTYGASATADLDGDGRLDIAEAVGNFPQRFQLMHNEGPRAHYLEVRLAGHTSNRDGIGAWITLKQSGRPDAAKYVTRSRGSIGSSWPVTHFGLGSSTDVSELDVSWPSGKSQVVPTPKADQLLVIDEP